MAVDRPGLTSMQKSSAGNAPVRLVISCSYRTPFFSIFSRSPALCIRTGSSGESRLNSSAMSTSSARHTMHSESMDGDTMPRSICDSMLIEMPASGATSPSFRPLFSR